MRSPLPVALAVLMLLSSAGCASVSEQADGATSYRYSAFDFSGGSWAQQQQRCAARSMKPKHLGTDCGFWTCTSRYGCEPRPDAPGQNSVAQ